VANLDLLQLFRFMHSKFAVSSRCWIVNCQMCQPCSWYAMHYKRKLANWADFIILISLVYSWKIWNRGLQNCTWSW